MLMSRENLLDTYDESQSEDDEEKRTLFCANLDERVTEELLYEIFLQAGPIESARIPKDHNGRQRTFGFITYVHKSTLPYAKLLFQGISLYRKTLNIKNQGSTQPSPIRNYSSPGCSIKRPNYDNSSLRDGNYASYNESPPQNPFRNCYPLESANLGKHQVNISKHASSQRRSYTNSSPYQRKSGGSGDRRENDHNRRRHYNNGSNRHSNQRSGSKNSR